MNNMNALGYFMDYCNRNMSRDQNVTQESFEIGMRMILASDENRFYWCQNAEDVLTEIHWPIVE